MKNADYGMLYLVADYLFANSTESERLTILKETARGRKEKNLSDNDGQIYFRNSIAKREWRKIKKTLRNKRGE